MTPPTSHRYLSWWLMNKYRLYVILSEQSESKDLRTNKMY